MARQYQSKHIRRAGLGLRKRRRRKSEAAEAFTLKQPKPLYLFCHYNLFSRSGSRGRKGGLKDVPSSCTLSRHKLHSAVFYLERRHYRGVSGEQQDCHSGGLQNPQAQTGEPNTHIRGSFRTSIISRYFFFTPLGTVQLLWW